MEIIKIRPFNYSNGLVEKARKMLVDGEILIFPTDTVYGLLANAGNKKAMERIFAIKKRKTFKPLPFFISSIETAKKLAKISPKKEAFLEKAWPGKITVVLEKRGGEGTIGLRIPDYFLLNQVLEKTKMVLTATSANISGQFDSGNIEKIIGQFKQERIKPDIVIDAGDLPFSKPSTVVDLTGQRPKILRSGAVSQEKLERLWQES